MQFEQQTQECPDYTHNLHITWALSSSYSISRGTKSKTPCGRATLTCQIIYTRECLECVVKRRTTKIYPTLYVAGSTMQF